MGLHPNCSFLSVPVKHLIPFTAAMLLNVAVMAAAGEVRESPPFLYAAEGAEQSAAPCSDDWD